MAETIEPAVQGQGSANRDESSEQFDMDVLVGYILLFGVLLSMAFLVAGLIWRWAETRGVSMDYRLAGMNLFELVMLDARRMVHGQFRARMMITSGILVLMLTPYLRVVASMLYFLTVLKNWKYTVFTSIVLIVLTYSLFLR